MSSYTFKAGKMRAIPAGPNRFRVEADERRGKIILERAADGSIHFKWVDRYTLAVDDNLLVFPGDQTFTKVDTGRDKDRVYLLQFKHTTNRRFFFWMQESDATKDGERCQKLNEYMQNPALIGVNIDSTDRTQQTLFQLLQNLGTDAHRPPASGTTANAGTTGAAGAVQIGDLSSILASISGGNNQQQPQTVSGAPATTASQAITAESLQNALQGVAQAMHRTPPLQEIIRSSDVAPLLLDPEVQAALLPLLPENMRTPEELRSTLSSPQFRQALVALSDAIQSENFETVMASLALNPAAGAEYIQRGDGIGAFIAAVLAKYPSSSSASSSTNQPGSEPAAKSDKKGEDDNDENFYE